MYGMSRDYCGRLACDYSLLVDIRQPLPNLAISLRNFQSRSFWDMTSADHSSILQACFSRKLCRTLHIAGQGQSFVITLQVMKPLQTPS